MKSIEIHLNGKLSDLKPSNITEAQEQAKKLITCDTDEADIYTVEKQHIITLKKTANKITKSNVGKIEERECLWTNYDIEAINGVYKLKL